VSCARAELPPRRLGFSPRSAAERSTTLHTPMQLSPYRSPGQHRAPKARRGRAPQGRPRPLARGAGRPRRAWRLPKFVVRDMEQHAAAARSLTVRQTRPGEIANALPRHDGDRSLLAGFVTRVDQAGVSFYAVISAATKVRKGEQTFVTIGGYRL